MTAQIIEIIGLNGTVTQSSNNHLFGISGQIIDETKHMIIFKTKSGEKMIPKNSCQLQVSKNDKMLTIDISQALKRPHERLEVFS